MMAGQSSRRRPRARPSKAVGAASMSRMVYGSETESLMHALYKRYDCLQWCCVVPKPSPILNRYHSSPSRLRRCPPPLAHLRPHRRSHLAASFVQQTQLDLPHSQLHPLWAPVLVALVIRRLAFVGVPVGEEGQQEVLRVELAVKMRLSWARLSPHSQPAALRGKCL